jgi:UDP-2-acetamido-3-amino-2,3-dideoxy-glucuronate N-acetyltransferase
MKRILLIGVGRWGANHLRVLKSMPIELFVADDHEQRLSSADIQESHRSTDARSLFPKIDAAVVVTPAPAHFETCRELLEMGKDVFVEKPITLVSSEAKQLTELAKKRRFDRKADAAPSRWMGGVPCCPRSGSCAGVRADGTVDRDF